MVSPLNILTVRDEAPSPHPFPFEIGLLIRFGRKPGVGWGAPTVWAFVWTWITVRWAQRALQVEKECWKPEISQTA
jgi:hypothetical protein